MVNECGRDTCIYCGCGHGDPDPRAKSGKAELRPYGPRGAYVCFFCMKETPEREAEAHRNLGAALDAAGPVALLDGDKTGVRPYKPSKN